MHEDFGTFERFDKARLTFAQVIYPDRGVCDNDAAFGRRRGTRRSRGSLPPKRASRRALSRAIKASSPACMSAVRSLTPVTRCACASNSSSMLMVVRIRVTSRKMLKYTPGDASAYAERRRSDKTSAPLWSCVITCRGGAFEARAILAARPPPRTIKTAP
jgi:hypothetical protein